MTFKLTSTKRATCHFINFEPLKTQKALSNQKNVPLTLFGSETMVNPETSQSRDIPVSQRFRICVCVYVLVCHCKCPAQRVTNSTCAVFQLKARLKPRTSYSHFLSCFGAQKTMLFPQEAGHPLSFPPPLVPLGSRAL